MAHKEESKPQEDKARAELVATLERVRAAALPEGPEHITAVLEHPRALVYLVATIGLMLARKA